MLSIISYLMSEDIIEYRLNHLKDFQYISIPELLPIYKLESNRWLLEEFTRKIDSHIEFMSSSELNDIIEKINPCQAWHESNNYAKIQYEKLTGIIQTSLYHKYPKNKNDVFNMDLDNYHDISICIPHAIDITDKILCNESRYFYIEIRLYGGYISENKIFLVFDKLNKKAFILDLLGVLKQKFYDLNITYINEIFNLYVKEFDEYKYDSVISYNFNKYEFVKEHIRLFVTYLMTVCASTDLIVYLDALEKINNSNNPILKNYLEIFNLWFYYEYAKNNGITFEIPKYINPYMAPVA